MVADQQTNKNYSGVTLLELVLVMLILSLLSTFATIKISAVSDHTVAQQAQLLAEHIRHTQRLAMAWGVTLGFENLKSGYRVRCLQGYQHLPCMQIGDVVLNPSTQQPFVIDLKYNIIMIGKNIGFDGLGRPILFDTYRSVIQLTDQIHHYQLTAENYRWQISIDAITGGIELEKLTHQAMITQL